MNNYLRFGPIALKVGNKHLADWGFPVLSVGGLSIWTRTNDGRLNLASYHPRKCLTWHWSVSLYRSPEAKRGAFNCQWRKGYGERGLCIFGWTLGLTEQGYHRET